MVSERSGVTFCSRPPLDKLPAPINSFRQPRPACQLGGAPLKV